MFANGLYNIAIDLTIKNKEVEYENMIFDDNLKLKVRKLTRNQSAFVG